MMIFINLSVFSQKNVLILIIIINIDTPKIVIFNDKIN